MSEIIKTFKLSVEGKIFEVPETIITFSGYIKNLTEFTELNDGEVINIEQINADTMSRIINFYNQYKTEKMTELEKPLRSNDLSTLIQPFYAEFISGLRHQELKDLINAAMYLQIEPIIDLGIAKITTFIRGKSPEEIRINLGLPPLTEEEAAEICKQHPWTANL